MNIKNDQAGAYMQFPAAAYPLNHPYPVALRRVEELSALLASCSIIDVAALTRYTVQPQGGMSVDQSHGPWLLLLDVMGKARGVHPDDEAITRFANALSVKIGHARTRGRSGWDRRLECSTADLAAGLVEHVNKSDPLGVALYAMMLHQRGADDSVLPRALECHVTRVESGTSKTVLIAFGKYIAGYRPEDDVWTGTDEAAYRAAVSCCGPLQDDQKRFAATTWESALKTVQTIYADSPEALQALDYLAALAVFSHQYGKPVSTPPVDPIERLPYTHESAETFAQALIAKGWHNDDINCVAGVDELLVDFLGQHVGEVSA